MRQWRKVLFWAIIVLAAAVMTDPILSVQDMLGYDGLTSPVYVYPGVGGTSQFGGDWFVLKSYALHFGGPRSTMRSWLLVAAIIGLGALLPQAIIGQSRQYFFFPASVIVAAFLFRAVEVLTEVLMVQGICLSLPRACPNEAMFFWEGDRFTVIAYLALGAAIVIGGVVATKVRRRINAEPGQPLEPMVVAGARTVSADQTAEAEPPHADTALAGAPALT